MFNDQEYMKGILGESVHIPPALRDYSSGTVAYVMRQVYTNMFPQITDPDAWKEFYSQGSAGSPFYEEAMQEVRKFPLSKVPNFTKIQEEYSVDKLTYKGQPVQASFPGDPAKDDWAYKPLVEGMKRGEETFKGLTNVGGLQKFIVSSMYDSIMQVGARRFQGKIMEGLGSAVERIMGSFHLYDAGVDVFSTPKTRSPSSYFFMNAIFGELQNVFDRVKDPLGKPGVNINTSSLDLPSIAAEESRLKPIPGKPGSYQLPGLFSRTGKPFDRPAGDPMAMLEQVRQVGGPGWRPIQIGEADVQRFDQLFGHTYGPETGQRPSAAQFNIIETYRDYLTPGIERHQTHTPINYTMEFTGEAKLGPERARIYRDMPERNPTGYYIDRAGNITTNAGRPMQQRWLGGGPSQAMLTGSNLSAPGRALPKQVTFDPMRVKFLMGHQTQADLQAFPSMAASTPQYAALQAIIHMAGGTPSVGDPYPLQRQAARRIYTAQDYLTNQLGSSATQQEYATILEWEAQGMMRDPDEGMVYNPIDAGGQPGTSRTVVNALQRQIDNLGTQISLNVGNEGPVSDRWYLNALERKADLEARLAAEYAHYGVDKDARAIGRSHRYVSQQFSDSTTRTAMLLAIEKKNMPAVRYPQSAIGITPYMREQDAGIGGQLTLGKVFGIENIQYGSQQGLNVPNTLFGRDFPQPAADPTGRPGQGAGMIRVNDRFITVTPPPGEYRILPDGTEINKPGAPHTWVNDPTGTGRQRVAGIYPGRKFGNVSPANRNELDYLTRPSVNRLSMLDDRPADEVLTSAEQWDIEDRERQARIAYIRSRSHIDAAGSVQAGTVARASEHWTKILPNVRGGKVANMLYSAGITFFNNIYNPQAKQQPAMPDDPFFEDTAYTPVPRQSTRDAGDSLQARISTKVSNVIDDVNRRLEIKYGSGMPFAARQLEPTEIPKDVLPEEEAFAGTSAKGIAIGEYGYLRGEFMTQKQLEDMYSGRELLQKGYLEGRTAASHEIGHVVFSKLPDEMQGKFSALFNKMVNKLGKEKMLSADVSGKKFNFSEEFSAAYSIAATQGADALKEYYPEYSKFFSDHWEEIERAEDGTKVIRYSGDKNAKAFHTSRQLQRIHGELPIDPTDPRHADYQSTPADRARQEQMMTRALIARGDLDDDALTNMERYARQNPQFSQVMASSRLYETLGQTDIEHERIQRAASRATASGQGIGRGGTLVTTETETTPGQGGEVLASASKVQGAMGAGKRAVEMALDQGNLPTSQREWAASLIERTNKFVAGVYDQAIKQAAPGAEKQALTTLKNIGQKVAQEYILGEVAGSDDFGTRGDITGMVYGARQNITTPQALSDVARGDPRIAAMVQSGELTPEMTTGPARILQGTAGTYQVGGDGPPTNAYGGRLNLWGGRAGAAMYSSYIVKRMWQMTAAPALQGAAEYGTYMGSFAGVQGVLPSAQGVDLASTAAGFEVRQMAQQRAVQRGAYQQFGGFTDMATAFGAGGGAGGRLLAAGQAAMGIGVAGAIIGQTAGFIGGMSFPGAAALGSIGAMAVPAAAVAAGAVGAGALLMEGYNALSPQITSGAEEPISYGWFGRRIGQEWIETKAMLRAGVGAHPGRATQEEIQAAVDVMTPQERAIYEYQGELPETRRIRMDLEAIEYDTGETVDKMQGPVRQLARGLNGRPAGFVETAKTWNEAGLTVQEGTQAFMQLAGQFGYKPGTKGFAEFWDNYNATIETQGLRGYTDIVSRGGKIAQFGGQIQQYYTSPSAALQLTDKFDLTTASRMMPVQSMLSTAAAGGVTADTIIGYNATERFQGTPLANRAITYDTAIAQLADRRGALMVSMVDQPVQAALQASGFAPALAPFAAEAMGFTNPMQAQAAGQWLGMANRFGAGFGNDATRVIGAIPSVSNFQAGIIPGAAEASMRAGNLGAMGQLALGMGQNLPDDVANLVAQGMAGDLGSLSYLARQQIAGQTWTVPISNRRLAATSGLTRQMGLFQNPYQWQTTNQFGQPIGLTDFGGQMRLSAAWANEGFDISGATTVRTAASYASMGDNLSAAQAFFAGTSETEGGMQAWAEGSLQGRTEYHRSEIRRLNRAAAGIAGAGAALSAQHLWGGGAWTGTPAADSIWGLQDRLRAMGNANQLQQFRFQRQMMETQNQFAIRGENIQGIRMEVGHDFSRWQTGFQFQGMMMQRGFAREDFQYNQQMRNMSFGWQMEDFDEAIRTSTGRQRAQLVRQRDRAATKFNLEGEQVDRQQERQEEMWAREDERFAKTQEYQETMMELDEETFALQKEQRETLFSMEKEHFEEQVDYYKERYKIETDLIDKQRDYQAAQIALQGAAAAIQAEMNAENEAYAETTEKFSKLVDETTGAIDETVSYEPEKIFEAFTTVVVAMDKLTVPQLNQMENTFTAMDNVDWNVLREIQNTMSSFNSMSADRLNSIADAIWRIINISVP